MFCNFAYDSTLNCKLTTENLQSDLKVALKWFGNNQMKANRGKFQYIILGKYKTLKNKNLRIQDGLS